MIIMIFLIFSLAFVEVAVEVENTVAVAVAVAIAAALKAEKCDIYKDVSFCFITLQIYLYNLALMLKYAIIIMSNCNIIATAICLQVTGGKIYNLEQLNISMIESGLKIYKRN